jgi:two-component system response regulator HydG
MLEAAHGTTLFLDEVGVLQPSAQARLCRALEQGAVERIGESRARKVDVRIVASTQRDLRAMVKAGSFRGELFRMLGACFIELPALRERGEDIGLLAKRFLSAIAPEYGSAARAFSSETLRALEAYSWPGNVRELRAAVERAAREEKGGEIHIGSLPLEIRRAAPLRMTSGSDVDLASMKFKDAMRASQEETHRRYLEALLARFQGDVGEAAAHARIERESFYRLLRRTGLAANDFRRDAEQTEP